ncbi:MAG: LysM peptidoglycan-binding domain-containing protein [Hyphomicrobiaceae bacterium]
MPGIKLAGIKLSLFSLAVLSALFTHPVLAAADSSGIQTLEWGDNTTSAPSDSESSGEPARSAQSDSESAAEPARSAPSDSKSSAEPARSASFDTESAAEPARSDPSDTESSAEPARSDPSDTESTPGAASSDDVWQRIRSGFKISDDAAKNPLVAEHEAWYASRPDYVRRMIDRSRRYLFHIVQEVDRRAMPMEIALLPMVESAFNPTAESPSAASGIWQFMPSTGRLYGLKQDPWYDGRRDFTAATEAALDYLSKLYLDFGDWELALAAYNCGEGCVNRAIEKNVQQGLPTDYASLPLPNETRNYVPKLLAIRDLVSNPERYGIAIDALPNQPYFTEVTVHANMDMRSAARLAGMSRDEFIALNAAFPRKLIRADTPVNLLVPVDKTDVFQRNLETGSWDSWQPYAAQKGERLQAIAKRFRVSPASLEEHNQIHLKRGRLARGQTILVPVRSHRAVAKNDASLPATTAPARLVVQRGDTLFGIARRYGVTVAQLDKANPGLDRRLKPGQSLRLPSGTQASPETAVIRPVSFTPPRPAKPSRSARYTVKRGDTLGTIAQRFGIRPANLKVWNPVFKKRSMLRAGQTIVVSGP